MKCTRSMLTSVPVTRARACEELVAERGVRNRGEGCGTLADRLAVERRDAVLGHDVVHVAAGGRHARALLEIDLEARDGSFLGRRRESEDRSSSTRARCAANEVQLRKTDPRSPGDGQER